MPTNGESAAGDRLSHLLPDLPQITGRYFQVLGAPWIDYGFGWLFRVQTHIYLVAGIIGAVGAGLAVYSLITSYFSSRTKEPAETVVLSLTISILGSMC